MNDERYRNKPLQKRQKNANNKKSRVRESVEHIFAFMVNSMNGMYLHYSNLVRVSAGISLMNITYNLFDWFNWILHCNDEGYGVPNR